MPVGELSDLNVTGRLDELARRAVAIFTALCAVKTAMMVVVVLHGLNHGCGATLVSSVGALDTLEELTVHVADLGLAELL